MNANTWTNLLRAYSKKLFSASHSKMNGVAILDTAMGSENAGDHIIMDACDSVIAGLSLGCDEPLRIPTHYYVHESELVRDCVKILCGTNTLYKDMKIQQQWALPNDLLSYSNTCLLGVGLSDIGIDGESNAYTKELLKLLLSSKYLHSVRDSLAKDFLNQIGFENVINTACPTMWGLTPEHLASIPREKASRVVTCVTDYSFDPEIDSLMFEILSSEYREVYVWLQGSHDFDWCIQPHFSNLDKLHFIGPHINDLNSLLLEGDIDYVGTRLHAGIRALNMGHRALIIAVDNRARQIGLDTNLPVIERRDVANRLQMLVNEKQDFHIDLPVEEIKAWKEQFER